MNYGCHQKWRRQKQTAEPQNRLIWHFPFFGDKFSILPVLTPETIKVLWPERVTHSFYPSHQSGQKLLQLVICLSVSAQFLFNLYLCAVFSEVFSKVFSENSPCLTIFVQFISLHSIFYKLKGTKMRLFCHPTKATFLGTPDLKWNIWYHYHYHNQSSILFNRMKDINICVAIVLI